MAPYTFTVKHAAAADVVCSGSWTISQSEWTEGGTGSTSYFGLFVQDGVATTDVTQTFTFGIDSYTVISVVTCFCAMNSMMATCRQ